MRLQAAGYLDSGAEAWTKISEAGKGRGREDLFINMADGIPPDILQHHVYEVRFGWEGITDDDIHEKQKDVWHYNSVPVPETTGGAKPVVGRALETITAVHPKILDPINIDSEDMQVRINLSLPKNSDGSTRVRNRSCGYSVQNEEETHS